MSIQKKIVGTMLALLALAIVVAAQDPTNLAIGQSGDGFVYIGHGYGESNSGQPALHQNATFVLPKDFKLDRAYHQAAWVSSGGGARPDVTVAQVPSGIYIRLDGGYYWAIGGTPNLVAADFDADNVVTQWKLEVPMYCGPGGNGQGCNMKVDVWAKRKP
jgi:hypothetical protein